MDKKEKLYEWVENEGMTQNQERGNSSAIFCSILNFEINKSNAS